jgi:UDP-2,3-diacylglucosamine pyrophosphatase LpxH
VRKLKLVISDLHMHTGARLPDGRRNPFEDFLEDELLIEFLAHFSSGDFAADDVELIVNGDFFNLLEIPVDGRATEAITEQVAVAQMRQIVAGHPEVFAALRDFVRRDRKQLTLIVGNHDAALLFPGVQKTLRDSVGRHVRIETSWSADGILIAHGHQYEFIFNFDMRDYTRRGPDGVELLKLPYGSLFVIQYLRALKQRRPIIDKVRPFGKYLRWAFWNDHFFFWRIVLGVVRFWALNRFSRDPYRRREFRLSPLRFADAMSHRSLERSAQTILRRTHYRLVTLGHSHKIDYRHLSPDREYFNTGSWTEIMSLDIASLGRVYIRPYLRIDYVDGAPHATLHNWIGSHRTTHPLIA